MQSGGDGPGGSDSTSVPRTRPRLPRGVWVLGLASLFMDASSELIHSLLPVFLSTVLGVSMLGVGVIEGIAEATAAFTKVISGTLSDYLRRRKFLLVIGYGMAALTKPVFPLAQSVGWVLGARFVDRIGKGIRGAPRDALIADMTPKEQRGAAYGIRQTLDSVGAFLGPALALTFMVLLAGDVRAVMWIGVPPALITVLLLIFALREQESTKPTNPARVRAHLRDAKNLSPRYWFVVTLGFVFTLARFSEAFLILRAQDAGLDVRLVPLVLIVMNVFYSLAAYPAGAASDHSSPRRLLIFGLSFLIVADLILAFADAPWKTLLGAAFWGLHMAFTQGLLSKLVAEDAPPELRGTAFGVFNLATGVALLVASTLAGWLWHLHGPAATFVAGAVFATVAALGLLATGRTLAPGP